MTREKQDLADEEAWARSFRDKPEVLRAMAREALEEHRRGETRPLDELVRMKSSTFGHVEESRMTWHGHSCLQRRESGLLISWNCHEPRTPLPGITARKHDGPTLSRDQRERFLPTRNRLSPIPWRIKVAGSTSGVQRLISALRVTPNAAPRESGSAQFHGIRRSEARLTHAERRRRLLVPEAKASAIMASLFLAILEPSDEPKSNITEGSARCPPISLARWRALR